MGRNLTDAYLHERSHRIKHEILCFFPTVVSLKISSTHMDDKHQIYFRKWQNNEEIFKVLVMRTSTSFHAK